MCPPHPEPPSYLSPTLSLWLSQSTSVGCPASRIELVLVIYFTYDNVHVSVLFSQIPPSPFPTESKSLFFTSVSLLLSCIWGHHYRLSKFHIYFLIYYIGISLSDLLHSVCVCVLVAQLCLTLCEPMDCRPPVSFVHGILQARILQWIAMPSSKGSSWFRKEKYHYSISKNIYEI